MVATDGHWDSDPMPLRLCLFGASDDTGNLGVAALLRGVLAGVAESAPDAEVVVFDHGQGAGWATVRLGDREVRHRRVGAPCTRRIHRSGSFARLAAASLAGAPVHPGAEDVRGADAVLVLAGGDSFADLYGQRRLDAVTAPMRLALNLGRPLILLPQTYGPYRAPRARRLAERLVRRADMSWARDGHGYRALADLTGTDHDPARHRLGIDVAFGLPAAAPAVVDETYREVLDREGELVAINVSGLLAGGGVGDPRRAGTTAPGCSASRGACWPPIAPRASCSSPTSSGTHPSPTKARAERWPRRSARARSSRRWWPIRGW